MPGMEMGNDPLSEVSASAVHAVLETIERLERAPQQISELKRLLLCAADALEEANKSARNLKWRNWNDLVKECRKAAE